MKIRPFFWQIIRFCLLICSFFLFSRPVSATHIKAADLYAKVNPFNSTDPYAYRVVRYTLNLYVDKARSDDTQNPNDFCYGLGNCSGTFNFGDGTAVNQVRYASRTPVGNNTYLIVFYFDHTYNEGTYTSSYIDENRNNLIHNMSSPSNALAFSIQMSIRIDAGFGGNQTPQMSIPPVDEAEQGRIFIHNPGAYDIDGDSIAYRPYIPRIGDDLPDPNYVDPNVKFGGTTQDGQSPAAYTVNSKTGDVIWNAPLVRGLYNVAFIIEEWRIIGTRRVRVSYSVRDMQIDVKEGRNNPPLITLRKDSCISPGSIFTTPVDVNDPDGHSIRLEPYGELFQLPASERATLNPYTTAYAATPYRTNFSWTPGCQHVRKRPYQVFFKATDSPAAPQPALADIKSFFLTVVGPSPTGLSVTADSLTSFINLKWDRYGCDGAARKMEIYRRVGCDTVRQRNCVLGSPSPEYVLVGTVDIDTLTFTDKTALRGNVYSYAVAAVFEDKFRITASSYPSANACVELPIIAPVINKVSFEGPLKDAILVGWQRPVDIDTSKVSGPYQYFVYKKEASDKSYTLLIEYPESQDLYDTTYLDKAVEPGRNYVYYVKLSYFVNNVLSFLADSSEISTNVELKTTPISKGVRLDWDAGTPWQNGISGFYHQIWRRGSNDTSFTLIDSVSFTQNVSAYTYNDFKPYKGRPLAVCDTFFYYVTTSGSYLNPKIRPYEIKNNSFVTPATIKIESPPSAPVLKKFSYDCNTFNQMFPYKNVLNWSKSSTLSCIKIAGYNVYYSPKPETEEMVLLEKLDTLQGQTYTHSNLTSVAGCYTVTAFDNAGNESPQSNKICLNNCNLYELPNVFTPNHTGPNEFFRPIPPSPRFVESVEFAVYNRWGGKVFEKKDDIHLNWDGSGLPDGVYFYTAKVRFLSSPEGTESRDLKGWIQIIR